IRGPLGRDRGAPSGSKSGRAEKAHNGRFTGATHLSLLSAKTAGISGHNRATQAELSTYDWYAFAGHVKSRVRPHRRVTPRSSASCRLEVRWRDCGLAP